MFARLHVFCSHVRTSFLVTFTRFFRPMEPDLTPEEIAIYKSMSPVQKLALIDRYYRDARVLKRAALRMFHPEWTDGEV